MDDAAKQEVKRRFGARLRKLRKAQKLSQEKVALKAGIDRSSIFRMSLPAMTNSLLRS